MPSYVGERLRAARLSMNVTGVRVAAAAGLSHATVYAAETSEEQPSAQVVELILNAFGQIAQERRELKLNLAHSMMRDAADLVEQVEQELTSQENNETHEQK